VPVETATSLQRGILLLKALASDEAIAAGGLGVVQLSKILDEDKSQISRTLKAMHGHGLVERDADTRAYRLGWTLFGLAARTTDPYLLAHGEETLRELVEATGERVHLTVLQGNDVLTVLSESPARAIQGAAWVGRTNPPYCSATGQALLLDRSLQEVQHLCAGVEFERYGPNTVRGADEFYARIEGARTRGYALADEEFEAGHLSVAAPVRDFRGRIAAALNVSGPKFRLEPHVPELGAQVAAAAARMSTRLGSATG
jgi:IclR family KDG regulon transcriptional repressor